MWTRRVNSCDGQRQHACNAIRRSSFAPFLFLCYFGFVLQVKLTAGEYTNLKLTTPEDLVVASQILEARKNDKRFRDDDIAPEEYLSFKRANAKWADRPRGEPGVSELGLDEVIELSKMRADEKWSDRPRGERGVSELGDEVIELSKMRADEKWSDRPRGEPGVSELGLDEVVELSKMRANEKWTDKEVK